MSTDFDNILVFRTSIRTADDRDKVRAGLDGHGAIRNWSVDLEDIDCVLRIEADALHPQHIISLINNHGYDCAELD